MSGSGAGGKWMASSVKKKDIKELWEARYVAKEIIHRLRPKDRSSLPQSPMRGLCFSHNSSVGWDSLSTRLSAG